MYGRMIELGTTAVLDSPNPRADTPLECRILDEKLSDMGPILPRSPIYFSAADGHRMASTIISQQHSTPFRTQHVLLVYILLYTVSEVQRLNFVTFLLLVPDSCFLGQSEFSREEERQRLTASLTPPLRRAD